MQDVLNVILILEAQLIGLFLLLVIVGSICEWVDKKLNPRYPYCDIDPRRHIAFAWDIEGRGWIGNHLVVSKLSAGERREEKA